MLGIVVPVEGACSMPLWAHADWPMFSRGGTALSGSSGGAMELEHAGSIADSR